MLDCAPCLPDHQRSDDGAPPVVNHHGDLAR
jgi:hypothetical protein